MSLLGEPTGLERGVRDLTWAEDLSDLEQTMRHAEQNTGKPEPVCDGSDFLRSGRLEVDGLGCIRLQDGGHTSGED